LWSTVTSLRKREADERRHVRRGHVREATLGGVMRHDEVLAEITRLEEERLGLASRVMGGDPEAVEEDRRLERRIRELANADREARSNELKESWRRNHPSEEE
jgi:hypothetical protein